MAEISRKDEKWGDFPLRFALRLLIIDTILIMKRNDTNERSFAQRAVSEHS